jgi:hypothetical protein
MRKMGPDSCRTILVLSDRPYLSAVLRDHIDPQVGLLRWVQPDQIGAGWRRSRPYPWIVVGAGSPPPDLPGLVARQPILVVWSGNENAPAGAFSIGGFEPLSSWARQLGGRQVGNLTLAPYRGIRAGHRTVLGPALEGLLAADPIGLPPSPAFAGARRQLLKFAPECTINPHGDRLRLETLTARALS